MKQDLTKNPKLNSQHIWKIVTVLVFGLLLFLTFNKHSRTRPFNYHSQLFADKAGYYMYLPALFIYGFDAEAYPKGIDKKMGNGFYLKDNGDLYTKYSSGVAWLQAPFFLTAHAIELVSGGQANGFSILYHQFVDIAAVFYGMLGLILLFQLLARYYQTKTVILTLSLLVMGTNLLYYIIDETGMSHVYSFFLFAWFLKTLDTVISNDHITIKQSLILSFSFGLILLIRPTNGILGLSVFLLRTNSLAIVPHRIRMLLNPWFIVIFIVTTATIFTPEIIYRLGLKGDYVYDKQLFSNWNNPQFLKVWFSTNNGLFLYSYIFIVAFIGMIRMLIKRPQGFLLPITIFVLVSYICASWWAWNFGCSYGQRSFVEFYTILAFPLAFQVEAIAQLTRKWIITFSAILVLLTATNVWMTYHHDKCVGLGTWEWHGYTTKYLFKRLKQKPMEMEYLDSADLIGTRPQTLINQTFDNQNNTIGPNGSLLDSSISLSGNRSYHITNQTTFAPLQTLITKDVFTSSSPIIRVKASVFVPTDINISRLWLVSEVKRKKRSVIYQKAMIKRKNLKVGEWNTIEYSFKISKLKFKQNEELSFLFWNIDKTCDVYVDNFTVEQLIEKAAY